MNKFNQYIQTFVHLCIQSPREVGLTALLVLFAVFAVYKSTPPMVSKVFELKISKNGKGIRTLNDERDIKAEKTVWVDHLNLKDGYNLSHPKLGRFAFDGNYFIDINHTFTVKKPGKYFFYVGSDDGYSFAVDGKILCQYVRDRGYSVRGCPVELEEGEHTFELKYFQGGGHSGLTLAYRHQDARKRKWAGENSSYLKFN